ncbi:MAG: translocation/assembly module TamB domain-containing protein [Litorimonas sp.]
MTATQTDASHNPWPKRLLFGLLGLLILIALVVAIGWLWLSGSGGRAFVEERVEDMEVAGQRIAIDGLDGSVLDSFHIDRIELTGRNGVWLIARDVTVDWSPTALLSKTLDVDTVRIGDLDLLQRPILEPSGDGGESPIATYDVDGIDLPDVAIAEAVIGSAVQLAASGTLRHGPDGGDGVFSARSEQGDAVEADLAWSPMLVLSGEADIDGAPGGLLAGLLRLEPDQSVTADVSTRDDTTQVRAQIDGADFADLSILRGQSQVSVDGTVYPSRLPLLGRVSPMLGGQTEVEAVLPLDQGARAELTLRAPLATLRATGERRDGIIVLDEVALEATNPLQSFELNDISLGTIIARGRATIGEGYSFDGTVEGRNIYYQDYTVDRLQGPAKFVFEDNVLSFDTSLTGTASGTMARANGARLVAVGRLNLETRTVSLSRSNIVLPGLSFRGQGRVGYGERPTASFSGQYEVDTTVFRDGPGATLAGQATVRTAPDGPTIELTGRATDIVGLASAVEPIVENGVDYTASVRVEEGEIVVPRFTASNDRLDAAGSARWANGNIQSEIDYAVDRYDFAATALTGIEGTATVTGPPSLIAFRTELTADTLDAGALATTAAAITATGTYADGVTTADGTLTAVSEQGRIDTSGTVVLNRGEWSVTDLRGDLGKLSATGTLSGIGGDIAALRGDLVVSGRSPLVPAENVEARILLGDAQVDVDATLTGVNTWRLRDGTVDILAKGPRDNVTYTVDAEGMTDVRDLDRPLTLSAAGVADLGEPGLSTEATFDLSLGTQSMAGTVQAARDMSGWGGSLDADGLGGRLALALVPGADAMFAFDVKSVDVAELAMLAARPATAGTVSGAGEFTLRPDRIEGVANIAMNDLANPSSDAEPVSVVADLRLRNEYLIATLKATEGGLNGAALIEGPVDTFARAPFMQYPPAQPLQGRANIRGEVGPLLELFLPPRTDVSGRIETVASFTVPNRPDAMNGRFSLTNGRFEQGALGLRLQDIAMTAELSGETIVVPSVSANGVDGGSLRGSGRMGLGEGTGSVQIKAEKLRVIDRREVRAEVSGDLSVSRTTELFRLAGDLRVTDADLNIANLPKPGLPTLAVDFGDPDMEDEPSTFASSVTQLDLRVVSDGRINVRGRGLNASMSLDAAVQGAFDDPEVTGEMSIARGRFDFLGKRFVFRDSSVQIKDVILDSVLNFEAVRDTPDLTAVVQVTGTVERPEIALTSEPNLPEDEVLSRILFGRSPTQLSALETARLAAALAQLSGGSGFDLFGSLENAVGLDTLDVGQNDAGQTQLTTGKYLSDDVYLEVRTAAEGSAGIAVEWQVRDNVALEAETIPNESQRLSVQWRKDFD